MARFDVYYMKDLYKAAEALNITVEQAMHRKWAYVPGGHTPRSPVITPKEFAELWVTEPLFTGYEADHLEQVFMELQGENWNGDGAHNQRLEDGGWSHSSMSVGDIVHNVTEDTWHVCATTSWREIPCPLAPENTRSEGADYA